MAPKEKTSLMKRSLFALVLLQIAFAGYGQWNTLWLNDDIAINTSQSLLSNPSDTIHTLFRPYANPISDSKYSFQWNKGYLGPSFNLGAEAEINSLEDEPSYSSRALAGVYLEQEIGKRLKLNASLLGGLEDGREVYRIQPADSEISAGLGSYEDLNAQTGTLLDLRFNLALKASKYFNFRLGRGEHFLGQGYRSLFLSDNASAYPFFRIDTKVWKVQYTNLFSWQQARLNPFEEYEDKFTTSHVLSYKPHPRVSIQLFESIIWQAEDSLSNRGFDVQYLNPIIFYRPVEFATGSADNAIIGFGFSYIIHPQSQFYFQLALDEFLLSQWQEGNGWWGNKYGLQIGMKGHNVAGVEGLYAQAEFNMVRPFTYSHGSPLQNYAHNGEALAHPLGANFYSMDIVARLDRNDWQWRNHLSAYLKGDDYNGFNLGGDIFRSYADPFRDLGNFIGQGSRNERIQNSVYISKILDKGSDLRIQAGYHLVHEMGDVPFTSHSISLGIRCRFGDNYR